MRVTYSDRVKHICLICFHSCETEVLRDHHHCCESQCEQTYLEIIEWEHSYGGTSILEELASIY